MKKIIIAALLSVILGGSINAAKIFVYNRTGQSGTLTVETFSKLGGGKVETKIIENDNNPLVKATLWKIGKKFKEIKWNNLLIPVDEVGYFGKEVFTLYPEGIRNGPPHWQDENVKPYLVDHAINVGN